MRTDILETTFRYKRERDLSVSDFEEWVEDGRSEREEMYDVKYVSHIFENEYELQLQVNYPSNWLVQSVGKVTIK